MFVLCSLLFVHGFLLAYKVGQEKNLAIILVDTPAKFEPLTNATTYFELEHGSKIKILNHEGEWIKIKC